MCENYKTIKNDGTSELVMKKSKFLGYAKNVNSESMAKEFIESINKKHFDATHNVYAYVIRGKTSLIKKYYEDREPSGTAALPIFTMLEKEDLQNLVVVVTRYFGKILLGTAGLVKCYTNCAKMAIDNGNIVIKEKMIEVLVKSNYNLSGKLQYEITNHANLIIETIYTDEVSFIVLTKDLFSFKKLIKNISSDTVEVAFVKERFI